ncbi:MAG: Split AAA-ATPase protein PA0787, partial [uncultured Acetobacteraceae bacterium]
GGDGADAGCPCLCDPGSGGGGLPVAAVRPLVHRPPRGFRRRQRRRQNQSLPSAATAERRGGRKSVAPSRGRRWHGGGHLDWPAARRRRAAHLPAMRFRHGGGRRRGGRLLLRGRARLSSARRRFPCGAADQGGALRVPPRTPAGASVGSSRPGRVRAGRGRAPIGDRQRSPGLGNSPRRSGRSGALSGTARGAADHEGVALLPRLADRPGFAAPSALARGDQPDPRVGRRQPRRGLRHAGASAGGHRRAGPRDPRRLSGRPARCAGSGANRLLRAGLHGPSAPGVRGGRAVRRYAAIPGARRRTAVPPIAALPRPERAGGQPAPGAAGAARAARRRGVAADADLARHALRAARRRPGARSLRAAAAHRQGGRRDGCRGRGGTASSTAGEARPV